MRIAYVTLDETNRYEAIRMAPVGMTVEHRRPAEPLPDPQFDGCVYDLDHFPADLSFRVVDQLCRARPTMPIALHSFCLEEEEMTALRRNGVRVNRRLVLDVFEGFLWGSRLTCH